MAYQDLVRRFKFLTASLRRHGASHVVEVLRQGRRRSRYAASVPPAISADTLMHRFEWFRGAETFGHDFYQAVSNRLPISRANRKEFFTSLLLSLESYDQILTSAELISEGKFPALGICIHEPEAHFDWHRDYSSGRVWPREPFNRISFLSGDGSDVKYPWELSRMYWIAWLGKAYWITGNTAWSREFMRLVEQWRNQNPFNVGVNWAMPMEVAIRGFWLVMGYGLFYGAMNIPDEWWIDYLRLAWDHGVYLSNNLEYFFNLTNHYISNCFGLLALGSFFKRSSDGERWFAEGRRRLIEELEHQVLADGVHYERSIGYHGLVLEFYLIALVLCDRAGAPFPDRERKKIERMAEFMRDYIPPAGTVPQLGDSDDGVLMRLQHDQELYDHRSTLALAGAIFDRDDFRQVARGYSQSALLIAGSEGFERLRGLKPASPLRSRLYREGGFAILRSEHLHLLADVGEIGLHGNNDTLSFTLHGPGGAFIIDPGTYCYTRDPQMRNGLRSTEAHNSPMIDNVEIAEFDGLWRVKRDTTSVTIVQWDEDPSTVLEAEHHAYGGLPAGDIIVRRRWELTADILTIRDRFTGNGSHDLHLRFTVPHECTVRRLTDNSVEISQPDGDRLHIESSDPLSIGTVWYSPSYGVARQGIALELARRFTVPEELMFRYSYIAGSQ